MLRHLHTALLTLLLINGGSARGDEPTAAEPIPAKTVVLTFDDAVKSHVTVVAPLLQELGFGATFFITQAWMDDPEHFLSWDDVATIHKMGFEIGNHTWTHGGFSTPVGAARLADELARVEHELARVGVPKPISFAWTGNAFGPESVAVLADAGYRLARRGMQPEVPYGRIHAGPLFDPTKHHALLIPTSGDGYPDWNLAHFRRVVDRAVEDKIVVLQFHGVPDIVHPWVHTPVEQFRRYMNYLDENNFHVVALKDVEQYLPAEPIADDPTLKIRYPDGN